MNHVTSSDQGLCSHRAKTLGTRLYPIRGVKNNPYHFLCVPCNKQISCSHQGLKDIKDYCLRETHKIWLQEVNKSPPISQCFSSSNTSNRDCIKAEVMVTNLLMQHNLPIATSTYLGPLFKSIFSDSQIAKSYACSATKKRPLLSIRQWDLTAMSI